VYPWRRPRARPARRSVHRTNDLHQCKARHAYRREEVFGPVLSILGFEDEPEAIELANDTIYGLAAGVWTSDIGRAVRMSSALKAGTVWVNTYRAVSYMMPFGGMKRSGLGRESGIEAIREYLETKSVWISTAQGVPANPFILR
jgi:(Z)-2-((N-methylformamido)methylene)-5-hydroxybutyrolactone dehydrogenase